MKKLSQLVKENADLKIYKYSVSLDFEGNVTATSEGDAGELVDQVVDQISSALPETTGQMINYSINNIEETGVLPMGEYLGESSEPEFDKDLYAVLNELKSGLITVDMAYEQIKMWYSSDLSTDDNFGM